MIKILQPFVPHYREAFLQKLGTYFPIDILTLNDKKSKNLNFKISNISTSEISNYSFGRFVVYSILPFLKKDTKIIVLMLTPYHLSTLILLICKRFHKKKIILWGHGISITNYLKEIQHPNLIRLLMIKLADEVWLYTENEKKYLEQWIDSEKLTVLNNTIGDIDTILSNTFVGNEEKQKLRDKYNVKQSTILISSTRFAEDVRRVDLLMELILNMDANEIGIIIIGDGKYKPDFTNYTNVYDFGELYDINIKTELFNLADIYFQAGWVGLSIVEAMAYSKPIYTFRRSVNIFHSVEYSYIIDGYNGILFNSVQEMLLKLKTPSEQDLLLMGANAKKYANYNLTLINMVDRAKESLRKLQV